MPDQQPKLPHIDVQEWLLQSARMTLFPTSTHRFSDEMLFHGLTGRLPDESHSNLLRNEIIQVGSYGEGSLRVTLSPIRYDVVYSRQDAPQHADGFPIPVVGAFGSALEIIIPIWRSLISTNPRLTRLAVGMVLFRPLRSTAAAYEFLTDRLQINNVKAETASDFQFQINRPRTINVGDESLQINRLSKWACVKASQDQVALVEGIPQRKKTRVVDAATLELDINTGQDFLAKVDPVYLPDVLECLVEFAKEIADKGDVQ